MSTTTRSWVPSPILHCSSCASTSNCACQSPACARATVKGACRRGAATRSSCLRGRCSPRSARRRGRRRAVPRGDERIGHRRQGLGQSSTERPPGSLPASPIEQCLRVAAAVSGERPGTRRQVPTVGVVRIDCGRPGVVAIPAFVRWLPGLACVDAERSTPTAGLIGATGNAGMRAREWTSRCAPGR